MSASQSTWEYDKASFSFTSHNQRFEPGIKVKSKYWVFINKQIRDGFEGTEWFVVHLMPNWSRYPMK